MTNIPAYGQKGAIVSIRLQNFMTYDDVILKRGPNLNMILGPNGSGKSAIVCSIIVGLAGEVSLTGRATSPAGLVKKGSNWASTQIELYNEKRGNYVVERKVFITGRSEGKVDHKSEWKLNGSQAKKNEIQQLTSRLNIKVDNLCQFLPQDSVATFVKMNSSELLTSTLKAVGDNQLVEDHTKLIDLTQDIEADTKVLNRLKQDCEQNENNARRLEADVERLREREKLAKKKKICDSKIYHVRYLQKKKELDEGKQELRSLKEVLKKALGSSEPYKKRMEEIIKLEKQFLGIVSKCKLDREKIKQIIETSKYQIEEKKFACQAEFASFKNKEEREKSRGQSHRLKQQELASLENRLVEETFQDYSREIAKLEGDAKIIKDKIMSSNTKKQQLCDNLREIVIKIDEIKSRRNNLLAVKDKKVSIIASRRSDAHRVMGWLAVNCDKFKDEIHLPMMCEINVKDPRDADIIEHAIQEADLFAFVCQSEEDLKKFTAIARRELRAKINVILRPDKKLSDFENDSSQQQFNFSVMNFKAFLKDLIDAPDSVMRYLYGNNNFHNIPVFNECSEENLKYLMRNCKRFYVGNKFYNVSRSRYDNQMMTVSDTIRPARYLIHSLNTKAIEALNVEYHHRVESKTSLEVQQTNVTKEIDDFQCEWQNLADHLRRLRGKQDDRKRLEMLINRCRDDIQQLFEDKIDLDLERNQLQDSIKRINLEQMTQLERLVQLHKDYVDSRVMLQLNTGLLHVTKDNHRIVKRKYEENLKDTERFELGIRRQDELNRKFEQEVRETLKNAEEKIQGFKNGKLDARTKEKFQQIEEETVQSLELKIEELKARISGICQDRTILSEFERQNRELLEKRQKLSELQANVDKKDADRQTVRQNWLPKLNDVISEIDVHYQEYMRKLRYDGKVRLDFDSVNPDNFSAYGIMIMVRYRDNEQLIPLSSTRQSGGERSVATMIYMLALQTKTTVPFRCVDEINQGMDKDNERKVFELLVQTADESSSQYFLVSPKLLSNLPYSEKMKIHIVFSGRKLNISWPELGSDGDDHEDDGDLDETDDDEVTDVEED